jgi:acetyl-CoA carboxylase carboxyl transferase subunit beta
LAAVKLGRSDWEAPLSNEPRAGWLSRLAPGVRKALGKREAPDDLWLRCPATGDMVYRPDVEAAFWVTPAGHHLRLDAGQRLAVTFDGGVFERLASPTVPDDPLGFVGDKAYADQIVAAREASGEYDAMALAVGAVGGEEAVVAVQDFSFLGGSLSRAVGEAFVEAARTAAARKLPFVLFTATGGARMQEGTLSLMQMARTTLALNEVKAANLPYVVVLTDPTTAGVMASYAMLGDLHLAEPGALIGFTGRRVIEQTIRETLPDNFQRAEFLQERGMVDQIVRRADLPAVLGSYLKTRRLGRERAA